MGYGVVLRVVHCIVSGMVLFYARGTGPRFLGAPVPPDGNVANPTRPGTDKTTDREPDSEPGKSDAGHFLAIGTILLAYGTNFPAATLGT